MKIHNKNDLKKREEDRKKKIISVQWIAHMCVLKLKFFFLCSNKIRKKKRI